jgi:hypothetical protein
MSGKIGSMRVAYALGVVTSGKRDYRYTSEYKLCVYFEEDSPNYCDCQVCGKVDLSVPRCIVGHVIDFFDEVPNDIVEEHNHARCGAIPGMRKYFTDKSVQMLERAQNIQDGGDTWGYAADTAIKCAS